MDPALARTPSSPPVLFKDGLGQRRLSFSAANEPLELLALHDELTAVSSFEFALRDRVSRISSFQSEHFPRVRGVERIGKAGPLAVVSEHVQGDRLSQILEFAETQLLPIETDAALCLIRQLVHAVSVLHQKAPDLCHGAIGPERIVVTPQARLVIVEHVLGSALEQLHYSHEQYWMSLRIPLPRVGSGPQFDRRSDVTQAGITALALIVGRQIAEDEYPSRVAEMAGGTWTLSSTGGIEPLPASLKEWLLRAIQLDPRNPFPSALEAWAELDRVLKYSDPLAEIAALKLFLTRYHTRVAAADATNTQSPTQPPVAPVAHVVTRPTPVPATAPKPPASTPASVQTPASPVQMPASPVPASTAASRPQPVVSSPSPHATPSMSLHAITSPSHASTRPGPPGAPAVTPQATDHEDEVDDSRPEEAVMEKITRSQRVRLIAAAVGLIALTSGGTLAARRFFVPAPATESQGMLAVQTNPAGATVVIDGQQRGATPLSVALRPGRHVLELVTEGDVRSMPVTITAGGQVSHFIELPKTSSALGELQIRTEPAGAQVSVDGHSLGKSPLTADGLTPGQHTVTLENDLGTVTQKVTIESGTTASLVVPMSAPRGAPLSGWIAVSAAVDLQLYENQRLLGSSQTDRIMVPVGRHDLEISNEALGFRAARTVNVSPGQVASIKLDLPKAPMALNAAPWAEVWVDGNRVGETPIGSVPVSIGPHEVVFRHPELGERRVVTTVTLMGPAKVSVDMRKK